MTHITVILIIPSLLNVLHAFTIKNDSLSEYSYMVLIGTHTDQNFQLTSACCGCILTRRYILTTAHCFRADENWIALIGTVVHEKYLAVLERWILHPHYIATVDATYNDIALTVTEKFIDFERNMVKPLTIRPIHKDTIEYDLECVMLGWKTSDPESLTVDVTSSDYIEQANQLSTVFSLHKTFLSPMQCDSLISLIPDVNLMPDDSFMCVRHRDDFVNETQYGFIGSPLLCREHEHDEEWLMMGMKLNQRHIENGLPEFFVNIHLYEEYLDNRLTYPGDDPKKYYCHVNVCNKKYLIAGEYCLVGDGKDCFNEESMFSYHYPISSHSNINPSFFHELICAHLFFCIVVHIPEWSTSFIFS